MTKTKGNRSEEIAQGLRRKPKIASENRSYTVSPFGWGELIDLMQCFILAGGSFQVYTSRDGNALCISIRAGNDGEKYWVGPDDRLEDVIQRIHSEWDTPLIDSWFLKGVEEEVNSILRQKGAEAP